MAPGQAERRTGFAQGLHGYALGSHGVCTGFALNLFYKGMPMELLDTFQKSTAQTVEQQLVEQVQDGIEAICETPSMTGE